MDLQAADTAVTRGSVDAVSWIADSDLSRATPCAEWDLRALVAHMTAQHRGFAAAAEGRGADPAVWRPTVEEAEPVKAHAEAAAAVITAFSAEDVLDRDFVLPELGRTVPGRLAVGFHLVDYVVHGWDVARTLGLPYEPGQDVLDLALPIARAVPGGAARLQPDAAFAPALPVPAGAATLDEILLLLGRDPGWRP
jgi:uncharacterized protein (TIGR03086 family)